MINNSDEICELQCVHENIVRDVTSHLPKEEVLYDLAELFKVFGDTTRIRILYALSVEEMCVCDIAETLNMSQSAISHQLRVLKANKLVKNRRDGRTIYYSLADNHIVSILGQGYEHLTE